MERKITIEEHVLYKEDYQMKMLKANSPEGFLHVGGRGVNGSSYYDYDVSGKVSMQAMYARAKLKAEDIRHFMEQLGNVLKEAERYLLDIHCILMDPEYIFYEEGRYYFCYYPLAKQDIWEKFHILTEYMVKVADYQEEECVRLAFLLHKETMEDNYSLEKLIAACEEKKKEETKKEEEKVEEVTIDDFAKLQFKVGTIVKCEPHPKADRLLVEQVDLGGEVRQIVSGIAKHYKPEELIGKQVVVVTNLKPVKLRGVESYGMILCATDDKDLSFVTVAKEMPNGVTVR